MAELDLLKKRIIALTETAYSACNTLDRNDMGIVNYIPDSEDSISTLMLSINLFNMYIAIADDEIDTGEISFINVYADDKKFSKNDIQQIIEKTELDKDEFAQQVPVMLRVFVDADNAEDKSQGNCPLSITLYDLFATSGSIIAIANETVDGSEYQRLLGYLKTMYNYIKKNLKYGYSDIKTPEEMIKSLLKEAEVEINTKVLKAKKKGKDDEDQSETSEEDSETLEDLINELNSMVGLDEVKYDVTSLTNLLRIKAMRENMGLEMPPVSMHLVFSGNPGTGKTTVARLLAKIYKKIGVLSEGQLVETDRSGLVGGYVGQTALKVKDVVNSAIGGVLFIDEAYSLTPENMTNDYGSEAVDTLVKAMEDNRENLIVIVAGYPELMERFLASNPGLKSRFNKFINFRDYTAEELCEIFVTFCKKHGYRASKPTLEYVYDFFTKRVSAKEKNFANAREVRNMFEYAISRQANRVILISNPTKDNLTLLTRADVSGENIDLGKQQYMAQKVINDLTRPRRYGILDEEAEMNIDEFELPASVNAILAKNEMSKVKEILDFLDKGKTIGDIPGCDDESVEEIIRGLKTIGFENDEQ